MEKIYIGDLELTEEDARYFAVAYKIKAKGDKCLAPVDFCDYCPLKNCNYEEAIEYMKEYL